MSNYASIPGEYLAAITRELSGERILWAGQPSPEMTFRKVLPFWAFAIPWTVIACVFEYFILRAAFEATFAEKTDSLDVAGAYFFALFGMLFVGAGFFTFLLPWIAQSKARRVIHLLTTQRLVTAVMGPTIKITSFEPRNVISLERQEHSEKLGTLKMTLGWARDSDGGTVENAEIWLGIPDARGLEAQLREVLSSAQGKSATGFAGV